MSVDDDKTTEFVISRLAELVVVLFNEHVGTNAESAKARIESRMILTALGNWAARNGRADLMPQLHGLAAKIKDPIDLGEREPPFYEPQNRPKVRFRW